MPKDASPAGPRPSFSDLAVSLAVALALTILSATFADVAICAARLRRAGVETTAAVVQTGSGGHRGGWIRYRFAVGPGPQHYTAADVFRRRGNAAARVAPAEWALARRRGTARVRYLPANPWVNLPVGAPPFFENPWIGGTLATLVGGAALVYWALFAILLAGTAGRRARTPREPRAAA